MLSIEGSMPGIALVLWWLMKEGSKCRERFSLVRGLQVRHDMLARLMLWLSF